jgi:hypothetical protein
MPRLPRSLSVLFLFAIATPLFAQDEVSASSASATLAATQTSRNNAVIYAESWARDRNLRYPIFLADCTNFISQIVGPDGAGYPMTSTWYAKRGFLAMWTNSKSWTVVNDFLADAMDHGKITWVGMEDTRTKLRSSSRGDILSYMWSGATWDHLSFVVIDDGLDPNPQSWQRGALVDQHTTDRRQAIWTLQPYNPNWRTTKIGHWRVNYTR